MREQTTIVSGEPQRASLIAFIGAVKLDRPLEVTIREHRKRRSLPQNALNWMWLNEVARIVSEETGNDADDLHTFFKRKFLTPRIVQIGKETVAKYSTKKLTTAEFSAYLDRIYAFVTTELRILLPLPEERMAA